MSLKTRLLKMLKSKKGNSLLIAASVAISATMGIYYFNVLVGINQIERDRITHLYNAYQMGAAVKGILNDVNKTNDALGKLSVKEIFESKSAFQPTSGNTNLAEGYLTLREMIANNVITIGLDPTISRLVPTSNASYDIDASGVEIVWLDENGGSVIDAGCELDSCTDVVDSVAVKVNLAGTHFGSFTQEQIDKEIEGFNPDDQTNKDYNEATNNVWYYLAMFKVDATTDINGYGSDTLGVAANELTVRAGLEDILTDGLQANSSIDHPASQAHHNNESVSGGN